MSLPPPTDNYIGEPEYPSPWATKRPKEGLRDNDEAIIVSLVPDVCKSPSVPVPYPIVDFCGHDQNYTPTVRFTGQKAMVLRSNTTHVHGDEPGVGKGVKSGTVGDISEPIGHAPEVRAEGSPVIRHLDRFWMNRRNTQGEAIFVRDMKPYEAPKDTDPVPGSLVMSAYAAEPLPKPVPVPQPKPPGQVIRPDVPQWKRPPPVTPKGPSVGAKIGRLGKFGARVGGVLLGLLWPDPLGDGTLPNWYHDLRSPDPFRRRLAEEAQRLYEGDQKLRPDLEEWYRDETKDRPLPAPLPQTETVRVDPKKCYIFTLTFTTPAKGTTAEMNRQLGFQQAALNSKNPCKAAADIAQYPSNKPIGEAARPIERARIIRANADLIRKLNPKMTLDQAMQAATNAAKGKDALHTLDMVAGGAPKVFSGLGGQSENRSIGSQWSKGKVDQLAAYAADQCKNGCPAMQTRLMAV